MFEFVIVGTMIGGMGEDGWQANRNSFITNDGLMVTNWSKVVGQCAIHLATKRRFMSGGIYDIYTSFSTGMMHVSDSVDQSYDQVTHCRVEDGEGNGKAQVEVGMGRGKFLRVYASEADLCSQ